MEDTVAKLRQRIRALNRIADDPTAKDPARRLAKRLAQDAGEGYLTVTELDSYGVLEAFDALEGIPDPVKREGHAYAISEAARGLWAGPE